MRRLPSDIVMNILLRLPLGDIMKCKCVCKELLDLIKTREFVNSHLSQAVPGFVYFDYLAHTIPYKIVELVHFNNNNEYCCRGVVSLSFTLPFHMPGCPEPVHSSVNGLLFIENGSEIILSVCNPITRERIELPCPVQTKSSSPLKQESSYGFGVSRISGQYKVVRVAMYMDRKLNTALSWWKHDVFECQVYTVGTGSWRRIASSSLVSLSLASSREEYIADGIFLNGNLHWMAFDSKRESACISCFDLETEVFATSTTPPFDPFILGGYLCVLGDCLCLCSDEQDEAEFVVHIWVMKEYGDDKSWSKEFVIRRLHYMMLGLRPIKVCKDGDILIQCDPHLFYYTNQTKTIRQINVLGLGLGWLGPLISAAIYTPSFVPLKTTFPMENVLSF